MGWGKNNIFKCATFSVWFEIVWLFKINILLRLWHLSMQQLNNDVWALIAWGNAEFSLFNTPAFPALTPTLNRNTIYHLEMICQNCILWKKHVTIINLLLKYNLRYFLRDLDRLWSVFQQYREMLILKQSKYFSLIKN